MPNFVNNTAVFVSKDLAILERIARAIREDRLFAEFLPTPPELYSSGIPCKCRKDKHPNANHIPSDNDKFRCFHREEYAYLMDKYEAKDWFDWNDRHWGTKWEIDNGRVLSLQVPATSIGNHPNVLITTFQTAWAYPKAFMGYLEEHFDVEVHAIIEDFGREELIEEGKPYEYLSVSRNIEINIDRCETHRETLNDSPTSTTALSPDEVALLREIFLREDDAFETTLEVIREDEDEDGEGEGARILLHTDYFNFIARACGEFDEDSVTGDLELKWIADLHSTTQRLARIVARLTGTPITPWAN